MRWLYVILELSRITSHVELFWCSWRERRERRRKKGRARMVTRLYTWWGKKRGKEEGGKLVRVEETGAKWSKTRLSFSSLEGRAISWTRTRGIGCFRQSGSWREKRLTDEYLKFWRGMSAPMLMNYEWILPPTLSLLSLVSRYVATWRVFFFSATLFTLVRESELSRKVICSVHMRREAEMKLRPPS